MSGCGGDEDADPPSREDYQAAILRIVEDSAQPTSVYTDLVVERLAAGECEDLLSRFERQVDELVERVAALQPPEGVAVIHDEFVAAARESVERVGEARGDVEAGQLSCGDELNRTLYGMPSSERADRAIARLERRGYYVYGN